MAKKRNAQRDYDMYVRYKNGETQSSLARYFGLSRCRVNQIITMQERLTQMTKLFEEAKNNHTDIDRGIDELMIRYGAFVDQGLIVRAWNVIRIAKPQQSYGAMTFRDFLHKVRNLNYTQMMHLRNCGVKTASFLSKVKADYLQDESSHLKHAT